MSRETRPPREREHGDPKEQVRPLPRALIILGLVGGAWGAWYLATSGSEVSPLLGDQRTTAAFAETRAGTAVNGSQLYNGKCVGCHQATGLGLPGVFPPLAKSPWVLGQDRRLVQILLHGIQGPIDVLGTTYNGMMPAWNTLNDAEIAAVATYVRSTFGNSAGAISTDLVKAERLATAARTTPWGGGKELESMP